MYGCTICSSTPPCREGAISFSGTTFTTSGCSGVALSCATLASPPAPTFDSFGSATCWTVLGSTLTTASPSCPCPCPCPFPPFSFLSFLEPPSALFASKPFLPPPPFSPPPSPLPESFLLGLLPFLESEPPYLTCAGDIDSLPIALSPPTILALGIPRTGARGGETTSSRCNCSAATPPRERGRRRGSICSRRGSGLEVLRREGIAAVLAEISN